MTVKRWMRVPSLIGFLELSFIADINYTCSRFKLYPLTLKLEHSIRVAPDFKRTIGFKRNIRAHSASTPNLTSPTIANKLEEISS
jgi:hypothetical protein